MDVTRLTSQLEISRLKDLASLNISFKEVTSPMFHSERSWLKNFAVLNTMSITVVPLVSQLEISELKGDPLKIASMPTTLLMFHAEIFPLKLLAENISFIDVVRLTSHREISVLNDAAFLNISFKRKTNPVSHPEMSPLKDLAPANSMLISMIPLVSHVEISVLKEEARLNMDRIDVTRPTSHAEMLLLKEEAPRNIHFIEVM
mmetsp:Transcript_45731/g.89366  ORF Transcript_45731/g.89366 Transcript_45731/m.89366 type:complete len:203 (+) Transcript_45731:283-891(+)